MTTPNVHGLRTMLVAPVGCAGGDLEKSIMHDFPASVAAVLGDEAYELAQRSEQTMTELARWTQKVAALTWPNGRSSKRFELDHCLLVARTNGDRLFTKQDLELLGENCDADLRTIVGDHHALDLHACDALVHILCELLASR